jgi:hypothetical protein
MACLKRSGLASRGVCPRFIRPRPQSISAPPCMSRLLARIATRNRPERSGPSPMTCPRNRVRSGLACESRVRRSDDCAPRAKASSPPSSCSDAARERTWGRTDGKAAARPCCLPTTRVTPSPLSALLRGGEERRREYGSLCEPQSHCTTVTAKLSSRHSCFPHPIRRLRRHLPQLCWERGGGGPDVRRVVCACPVEAQKAKIVSSPLHMARKGVDAPDSREYVPRAFGRS